MTTTRWLALLLPLIAAACLDETPVAPPGLPPPFPDPVPHAGFYVAPQGSASGTGDVTAPWNLSTALAGGNGRIQPGDTVWLRGGTYSGAFRSSLTGAPGRPIVVRALPGERAILDGAGTTASTLTATGDWSVFQGFELTNSNPARTAVRPDVVVNYASHTKYVNLVIHDGGVAFYTDRDEMDVEISGCVIYNNGWQEPDRGHGHGIYIKSDIGPVIARDNVLFNQYGFGIHAYSDPGAGELNGIHLEGNVAFNNGTLSSNSAAGNLLVGGYDPADRLSVVRNFTYFSRGASGTNVQLGRDTTRNGAVSAQGNLFVGGSPVLDVGYWLAATVSGNDLFGADTAIIQRIRNALTIGAQWTGNRYYANPSAPAWEFAGQAYPFWLWQSVTGLGATDQAHPGRPVTPTVVVRPSEHEPGRAAVVVYNWPLVPNVTADLSAVLQPGDRYEVRNVQALFGPPVATGTYGGGGIVLPLSGVPPPVPVGLTASRAPRTGPAFDVFLVTRPVR